MIGRVQVAWTTMHFAVGMGCSGVAAGVACAIWRRGWRWIPATMTLGGVWALVPDMPRVFREDFYWKPVSQFLGTKELERSLHGWGDLFFFHRQLDLQPHEYALAGMAAILLFYNLSLVLLMRFERKQRNSLANRAWRAHRTRQARQARRASRQRPQDSTGQTNLAIVGANIDDKPAVIYRIRPGDSDTVQDDFIG